MINAGYKTLGAESLISFRDAPDFFWNGKPSFGVVVGRHDLWLGRLSAESSNIYYKDTDKHLKIGERLQIIPNNATLVISMHDKIYGVRKGQVEKVISVTGRERGT
jgi:D-serine deaminase-like pyridoxal phosphate-dependent protein